MHLRCMVIVITIQLIFSFALSQEISLKSGWKFIFADSAQFALPQYNDSDWASIDVSRWWNEQGYPRKAGFAWYRLHVYIPSALIEQAYIKDSLVFHLGKIDDFDQVFLNGQLLGENSHTFPPGSLPSEGFCAGQRSYWNLPRRYAIAITDPRIRWDQENVLAIRVYNWGGPGGLFGKQRRIAMADLIEYLVIEKHAGVFEPRGQSWLKHIVFRNRSLRYKLQGMLKLTLYDNLTEKLLQETEYAINLMPAQQQPILFQFPQYDHSTRIRYEITLQHSSRKWRHQEGIPYLLTPPPPPEPRINPPYIYGQRSGHPFLFHLATSGERPMHFTANGLPPGLTIDHKRGIIRGQITTPGQYAITIIARNRWGTDTASIQIIIGEQLALTPPMGWNSWNVWGLTVTQDRVLAAGKALVSTGLVNFGWQYINVDDGWEIPVDDSLPGRASNGEILTNDKFPDMQALADSLHQLGLKFGIYSSPGPATCGGFTGSYQHEVQDAKTFARWGVDYLKYDLCHYRDLMTNVNDPAELKPPYLKMYQALQQVPRDIVFSICEYGNGRVWEWGAEVGGNLWRTTGDIWDEWTRVAKIGFGQDVAAPYAEPGHWNDPDMLVIGWLGWGDNLHYTRLTPDEQYSHVSLWSLLAAPLLLGCDLDRLDPFTLNLITNPEVIAINQDPLGEQARTIWMKDSVRVYRKHLANGDIAIGLFNLSNHTQHIAVPVASIGALPTAIARDLWRQKTIGQVGEYLRTVLPPHGVYLLKINHPEK